MSPAYLNHIEECELHIKRWDGMRNRTREIILLIRNEIGLCNEEKKSTKRIKFSKK